MSLTVLLLYILISCLISWFIIRYILYKVRINELMKDVKILNGELPVVGHTLYAYISNIKLENSADVYSAVEQHLGSVTEDRRYWIMNMHFFIAIKQNTIEKILTSSEAVEKSYMYSGFNYLMNGIFIASTQKWRKMRKRLNMTFNPKFFPNFIAQMNYHSKIFAEQQKKKNNSEYRDILPLASKYFFDVISSTHFGVNTSQQYTQHPNVAEEVSKGTELVYKRMFKPWLHIDVLFEKTQLYKSMKEIIGPCVPFLKKLVTMSAEYQENTDLSGNTLGWKSYAIHCAELLQEMGPKPSSEVIGHTSSDLLVAGTDTASVTTSHLLYQLGKHPHYQELAYEEIMRVLNDETDDDVYTRNKSEPKVSEESRNGVKTCDETKHGENENNHKTHTVNGKSETESDAEFSNQLDNVDDWTFARSLSVENAVWTKAKLDRLHFVEALIKESLRLCSPPILARYLKTDIDTGEYIIPKGTNVAIVVKNIQRNPVYWEKPNEFYPDHFKPESVKERPKFSYLPFSHGPRDCPGKVFGMYGMKCLLVEIIQNFIIETKPQSTATNYKLVFMIEQTHGYPIKLIPRQK